jgi:hypothetical protein
MPFGNCPVSAEPVLQLAGGSSQTGNSQPHPQKIDASVHPRCNGAVGIQETALDQTGPRPHPLATPNQNPGAGQIEIFLASPARPLSFAVPVEGCNPTGIEVSVSNSPLKYPCRSMHFAVRIFWCGEECRHGDGEAGGGAAGLVCLGAQAAAVAGHVVYDKLNGLLREAGFDWHVEAVCEPYYAKGKGRPSVPPGVYFRMLLVGYFEGINSQRGIAWRCSDSLSLRKFLGIALDNDSPDHSSLT